MKPLGAACACVSSTWAAIFSPFGSSTKDTKEHEKIPWFSSYPSCSSWTIILSLCRLLGEPLLVVGLRLDLEEGAHPVVAQATDLGAGDLVAPLLDRREVHADLHP